MDNVRLGARAIADSLIEHIRGNSETKYTPIATRETEFKELIVHGEYEDIRVRDLPAEQYGAIKEVDGIHCLVFDTDNIPNEVLIEHKELFLEIHKQKDGFAVGDRGGVAKVMKNPDSDINSIFDQYVDRLPRRFLPVFEDALALRATERIQNLSRGTVYDWRGEIADDHRRRGNDPMEAQHLISLTSTGYFDNGGVFDEMYAELVKKGSRTSKDYSDIIDTYIRKNPFAVFVRSNGMTAEEVCTLTIDKAKRIERYPWSPGFIDICGKGEGTYEIIDQAHVILDNDYDAEMSEYRDPDIEQYILRVSPDTL